MNTTRKLFGLALAPLYFAIAQVESENGVTSRNMYQLTRIFLDDCETLTNSVIKDDVVYDRQAAEQLMFIYWRHYGERYEKLTGKKPTYEVLARIHNGGPRGYEKKATLGYWARIKTALEKGVNKTKGTER